MRIHTYRCKDGWLATAANTPHQFRKMMGVLGLERLCEDGKAIDLAAFNAPGGGFVVAKNLAYLRQQFNSAFAEQSAADMEQRLNEVGVPAARVRSLGEFLDEVDGTAKLTMPMRAYTQGQRNIRTPGLGFAVTGDTSTARSGAPTLGQDTNALLHNVEAEA